MLLLGLTQTFKGQLSLVIETRGMSRFILVRVGFHSGERRNLLSVQRNGGRNERLQIRAMRDRKSGKRHGGMRRRPLL